MKERGEIRRSRNDRRRGRSDRRRAYGRVMKNVESEGGGKED